MTPERRTAGQPHLGCLDLGRLPEGESADLTASADVSRVRFDDLTLARLDLSGALVTSSRFGGLSAEEADLTGTRLSEVDLDRVDPAMLVTADEEAAITAVSKAVVSSWMRSASPSARAHLLERKPSIPPELDRTTKH